MSNSPPLSANTTKSFMFTALANIIRILTRYYLVICIIMYPMINVKCYVTKLLQFNHLITVKTVMELFILFSGNMISEILPKVQIYK